MSSPILAPSPPPTAPPPAEVPDIHLLHRGCPKLP
jgi:hypothetical protein